MGPRRGPDISRRTLRPLRQSIHLAIAAKLPSLGLAASDSRDMECSWRGVSFVAVGGGSGRRAWVLCVCLVEGTRCVRVGDISGREGRMVARARVWLECSLVVQAWALGASVGLGHSAISYR